MKKNFLLLILALTLVVSGLSVSSLSAESIYVRKVVSVVYDDSGSMSAQGSMNWSYANYAMQTLCGLLNADDELYITYMSSPGTSAMPADFSTNRQTAVDNIRTTITSGNTPQSAVVTAQDKLVAVHNDNSSNGMNNIEYWLVVISDGKFNETGVFGQAELDTTLQTFSQTQIDNGMDLHTIYLAIGSNAIQATNEPSLNITGKKCDDGKAIVSVLSELSNDISGRYSISKDGITLINDTTVEVASGIPLQSIAILLQNSSAALQSIVSADGTVMNVVQQVSLKYPEKTGWTSDSSLNGNEFLVQNTGKNMPAGKYTLTFSGKVDSNALDIMVEPALEPHIAVLQNGKEVTDLSLLHQSDTIDIQMKIYESGTNNEVDIALLKGAVTYSVGIKENDAVISSTDTMALPGITLKNLKTQIYGTLTFGNFLPMTAQVEMTPSVAATVPVTVSPAVSPTVTPASQPETQPQDTIYGLIVEAPDNNVVDRNDLSGNTAVIRFVLTGNGVPLTKEESQKVSFVVSVDRKIPYSLKLEDDGSYTFRPLPQWPPLFYPTGTFTVIGTLADSVTKSGQFEISSVHIISDLLTLLLPLLLLLYILFYLTRNRFKKGFITRKIYFILDGTAREGSKSQVLVTALTGWWQFFLHSSFKKHTNLTFSAARKGEVSVKYHFQKSIKYQVAPLTDNFSEIEKIFSGDLWKSGTDFEKNIRISETKALYLQHPNNVTVYYMRMWRKRSKKRSKTEQAFQKKDNVVYMYEQGDEGISYNTYVELKKDALCIAAGTVISAKPVFRMKMLHTLSEVRIDTVYSGLLFPGDIVYVGEHGGRVTADEYFKKTELEQDDINEITSSVVNTSVVVGVDGFYPMPLGRHVLLFLQDSEWKFEGIDQKIYTCLGGYDGIFYQQSDKTTYVNPLPDSSGIHESLEELCMNGGRLAITIRELSESE